jgi:threonine aldolase
LIVLIRTGSSVLPGDTLTIPTDAMLLAGLSASRGDDVYREDIATAALESRVALLAGKEAGLFLVSGTMSNRERCRKNTDGSLWMAERTAQFGNNLTELAIRSHLTQPPHSVLLDYRSHVHKVSGMLAQSHDVRTDRELARFF